MTHRAFDGYVTNQTTNGVDGYATTIRAQNATGTGSKGGNLNLGSGTGVSSDGYVSIKTGNNERLRLTADGYMTLPVGLSVDGYIKVDGYTTIDGYTITFDGYAQAPKISQLAALMPGVDGYHMTIKAQNSTINPAHGGNLILQSGDGYNGDGYVRDGYVKLLTGSRNVMTLDGYNVSFFLDLGSFGDGKNVIFLANATVAPTTNPTGGGILYVENGSLKYRSPSGTISTLAPA
jgi:hypothetical protein